MSSINDVPRKVRARLITLPDLATLFKAANVKIVPKAEPPEHGPHRLEAHVSMGPTRHVVCGLVRGRVRVTVWLKQSKDRADDGLAAIAGATDGLTVILEKIANGLHHSSLEGVCDEFLRFDVLSASEGQPQESGEWFMGWREFEFGVITAMPFTNVMVDGTTPDIGEASS